MGDFNQTWSSQVSTADAQRRANTYQQANAYQKAMFNIEVAANNRNADSVRLGSIIRYKGVKPDTIISGAAISTEKIGESLYYKNNPFLKMVEKPKFESEDWNPLLHEDAYVNRKTGEKITAAAYYSLDRTVKIDRLQTKPGGNMITEIKNDIKKMIQEHKQAIYLIAILYLADRFLFEGHFKAKLKEVTQRLLGKAEKQLDRIGAADEQK